MAPRTVLRSLAAPRISLPTTAFQTNSSAVRPVRLFSSPHPAMSSSSIISKARPVPTAVPPAPPARWISELRARIGRCITFGCSTQQVSRAAAVLRALTTEWRELLAGSEGFLTGGRRGLDGQKVVWGEQDSFGHVNNVTYYRYAESARVNWITNFAVREDPENGKRWAELMTPKSTGLIMASLKCDFKFPMVYPDTISVYHKLRVRPEAEPSPPSAFVLDCIVLSHRHRRHSARLEEQIVLYDYKTARKTGMPPFMLDTLQKTWALQEEETARARARIWELIEAVESLERETWNRSNAVEDMGSAAGRL